MSASTRRVMYYHADASPVGGSITHPLQTNLDTGASISLPQAGGHTSSRIESFKVDHIIECGAAYSQASGVQRKNADGSPGNWATLVTTVVEKLNVLNVVTADRIVSRLAIEHPVGGYYPSISFVGCQYQGLRISGHNVDATINLGLLTETGPQILSEDGPPAQQQVGSTAPPKATIIFPDTPWNAVKSFVKKAEGQADHIFNSAAPDWLKTRYGWMRSADKRVERGFIQCSLVESVRGTLPGQTFGHVVTVPGFGTVFLGELTVDPASFRLTMLRIEMGCAADGDVSFGSTGGNGRPMP